MKKNLNIKLDKMYLPGFKYTLRKTKQESYNLKFFFMILCLKYH